MFFLVKFNGNRTVYSSIKLENEKTASPIAVFSVSNFTYLRKQPDFILLISSTNVTMKLEYPSTNEQNPVLDEYFYNSCELSL